MNRLFIISSLVYIVVSSKYIFVNQRLNWYDAQLFCQQTFGTRLAVIKNGNDNTLATQACQGHECWFDLNDRFKEGTFKYSNGDRPTYTNWAPHEPNNLHDEDCAELRRNGQWNDENCPHKQTFLCDNDGEPLNPASKYRFINQRKNWYDADLYCRQTFGTSLAVIENARDNYLAQLACRGHECWFDLNDRFKEGTFKYTNGDKPKFTNWAAHEPNNLGNEDCAEIRNNGQWNDENCPHQQTFLCNTNGNSKQYIKGPTKLNYLDAYVYCRGQQAAHLAVITSESDNIDAVNACGGSDCWIGFSDLGNEKQWQWLDGTKVTYTNWQPHEPNNLGTEHCGHILAHRSTWNDNDCLYRKFFPLCNPKNSSPQRFVHFAKSELIKTIENKVETDINSEPITNGIYFDNINVTSLVIFVIGVTLSIIFIALFIKALIRYNNQNKQKLYESIRQSETEESATDSI